MREILFRGKAKDGYKWIEKGEWIEGGLFYSDDENGTFCQIATSYLSSNQDKSVMVIAYEVDPETVCQYTGLTDKNGRKIFEGDIIKHFNDTTIPSKFDVGIISWDKETCGFHRSSREIDGFFLIKDRREYEVIGNIFDDSELLEVVKNEQ